MSLKGKDSVVECVNYRNQLGAYQSFNAPGDINQRVDPQVTSKLNFSFILIPYKYKLFSSRRSSVSKVDRVERVTFTAKFNTPSYILFRAKHLIYRILITF